jgi:hypothetical protein
MLEASGLNDLLDFLIISIESLVIGGGFNNSFISFCICSGSTI